MFDKIESFFLEKYAGKLIARAAVTIVGYLAAGHLPGGAALHLDPAELQAAMIAAAHAAFESYKAWRANAKAAVSDTKSGA